MPMRYASSIVFGSLIAAGLLLLMQTLIATGRTVVSPDAEPLRFDFVRVVREPPPPLDEPRPEKTPEPERRPEPATADPLDEFGATIPIGVTPPARTLPSGPGVGGFGLSDGDYLPIVTVAPAYPSRALQQGLEGHVVVEFTVTEAGSTRDVRVVESSSAVFERAAVESAGQYRYSPRVIDGEPVEVPGVQALIRFVLDE